MGACGQIQNVNQIDNDTITISMHDYVFFQLDGDDGLIDWVRKRFTFKVKNSNFDERFQSGVWDGTVKFINKKNMIPIGLFEELIDVIEFGGYKYFINFDISHIHNKNITRPEIEKFYSDLELPFEERSYQIDAVFNAMKYVRCTIESSVGSGKSLMIYTLIRIMMKAHKQVILVVPTTQLVEQMYSDLKSYGWDNVDKACEMLYSGEKPTFKKPVLITTWQSVYDRPESFFVRFGAIIVDECHLAKGSSLIKVSKRCYMAKYRWYFTGTLPDDELDCKTIFSYSGPVKFEISSSELMEMGYLTQLKIVLVKMKYPPHIVESCRKNTWSYSEESSFVENYHDRTSVIGDIAERHWSPDQNVILLAKHLDHIDHLIEYFKYRFPNREVVEISGRIKPKDRETIRKRIGISEGMIVICSYATMSTGVNAPKIHHVAFGAPYKSKIKVLQTLGRGLRLHETKDEVFLWDFADDITDSRFEFQNYGIKHLIARVGHYIKQKFEFKKMSLDIPDRTNHGFFKVKRN